MSIVADLNRVAGKYSTPDAAVTALRSLRWKKLGDFTYEEYESLRNKRIRLIQWERRYWNDIGEYALVWGYQRLQNDLSHYYAILAEDYRTDMLPEPLERNENEYR